MSRDLAELQNECISLGLIENPDETPYYGKREYEELLRNHYNKGKDILPQIPVMLARDAKEFMGEDWNWEDIPMWNDPNWVIEPKLDGNRFKMHIGFPMRFDSRRISDSDYKYSEKSENFVHFNDVSERWISENQGTVLDGEMIYPVAVINTGSVITASVLQSTSAVCNSGPDRSLIIQDEYGPIDYYAFDILFYKSMDVRGYPFESRRTILDTVVDSAYYYNLKKTSVIASSKLSYFKDYISKGGEGVMFKDVRGPYESDKRSKYMYKLKRFATFDAFVTGYIPGQKGFEGLVGALEFSVYDRDGNPVGVAAISAFTLTERAQMTADDGTLKGVYYFQVMELKGQEFTKTNRLRHAVPVGWRWDKKAEDCKIDQIEPYLIKKEI